MWHCSPENCQKILFLSGALFGRNFRERSFFCSFCVWLVFFVVVSPMFLIHYVALLSRNLPKKFSSCQVRFLEEISGANLFFFCFCVRLVFFVVVSPMFLIHYVALLSRQLPEKFSSCQVRFLEEIFGSELWFFSLCVRLVFFVVVFPMFLLYYVPLCSRKLSASNLVLSDAHVGRNFRERTFGFEPLCPVGVFVVVFPMFLLHYVALFSRKLSEKLPSFQARFFEPLFGNKLLFLNLLCPVGVFWCCFDNDFACSVDLFLINKILGDVLCQ